MAVVVVLLFLAALLDFNARVAIASLFILAMLALIVVVGAAIVVAARAIRGTGRPPAEEDAVPSRIFAPSGLIATPAEKEVQKLWDALPQSPGKSVGTSAH